MLSREVVNDILAYAKNIHTMKLEFIKGHLQENFNVDVSDQIDIIDNAVGIQVDISSHYKRDQYLSRNFKFIKPVRFPIGKEKKSFYYSLPIKLTLGRLLEDDSLRSFIIQEPIFSACEVR